MKTISVLTLNCQKAYHPDLKNFIDRTLSSNAYDFILMQEVTPTVIGMITETASSYKILNPFDSILEENTGVCVLYRDIFVPTDPLFLSFARINLKMSPKKKKYDFSKGVRGKYYKRYNAGTNVVLLDRDVSKAFPDSEAVNDALRSLIAISKKVSKHTAV